MSFTGDPETTVSPYLWAVPKSSKLESNIPYSMSLQMSTLHRRNSLICSFWAIVDIQSARRDNLDLLVLDSRWHLMGQKEARYLCLLSPPKLKHDICHITLSWKAARSIHFSLNAVQNERRYMQSPLRTSAAILSAQPLFYMFKVEISRHIKHSSE